MFSVKSVRTSSKSPTAFDAQGSFGKMPDNMMTEETVDIMNQVGGAKRRGRKPAAAKPKAKAAAAAKGNAKPKAKAGEAKPRRPTLRVPPRRMRGGAELYATTGEIVEDTWTPASCKKGDIAPMLDIGSNSVEPVQKGGAFDIKKAMNDANQKGNNIMSKFLSMVQRKKQAGGGTPNDIVAYNNDDYSSARIKNISDMTPTKSPEIAARMTPVGINYNSTLGQGGPVSVTLDNRGLFGGGRKTKSTKTKSGHKSKKTPKKLLGNTKESR